ncbi:hypothetical protein H2200_008717 [Cladophialophora chaetospira]|uniref:Xylanolytic transcriptional activator regulatory domain-containing protein n=1 Tax=Cladophialophora chaetospira TaxID=386627 RepID=A0AA38X4J9_9EURO|nr:hypothetical protein H2200_008717 [Cladophialophora chaetospira]
MRSYQARFSVHKHLLALSKAEARLRGLRGRKSGDLEEEISKLKRQLSIYEGNSDASLYPASATDASAPLPVGLDAVHHTTSVDKTPRKSLDPLDRILSTTIPVGTSPESPDQASLPGATTIPGGTAPNNAPARVVGASSSRQLRDIVLSKDEINDLFRIYFSKYHMFLPFLDPGLSPDQYYDRSTLLFWSIISVASRRCLSNPTLLSRLARTLTDVIWKSLQALPHSLAVIQSLVLLCTWPFPTSSSSTDPSYMLSGMVVQVGLQMGLHRPKSPDDFTKFRLNLNPAAIADRGRTWIASNIVVQSVSCGVGLPTPAQVRDCRISQALASNSSDHTGLLHARERLPLYTILNHEIVDLENSRSWTPATTAVHLLVTKLHLHAFYLFDEPSTTGHVERIVSLYLTATSLIEHVRSLNDQHSEFLLHCPFFCYEAFLCAAFVVLKILKNDYFNGIVDAGSGQKLVNFSVSALRKMSVANNDLPGRLSDVLSHLWTHHDRSVTGTGGPDDLQLKVKSRMSMSVVYDLLWRWREQFRTEAEVAAPQPINNGAPSPNPDDQAFDISFDFTNLEDIYTNDLQFDWLN